MGRNKVDISGHMFVVYGYDIACSGYYALYFNTKSSNYKEDGSPSDFIGMPKGVTHPEIIKFLHKYKATEGAMEQTKQSYHYLCAGLPC